MAEDHTIENMTKAEVLACISQIDTDVSKIRTIFEQLTLIINLLKQVGLPTQVDKLIEINQVLIKKLEKMQSDIELSKDH